MHKKIINHISSHFKNFKSSFVLWIPLAVTATLLCGIFFTITQQSLRMSANSPQIQIAEDSAKLIEKSSSPDEVIQSMVKMKIDVSTSLVVWGMVFDEQEKVLVTSGQLDGKDLTAPPKGIFEIAKQKGEYRFTWAPKQGSRQAAVIRHFAGSKPGYILTGKSLREVEQTEKIVLILCGAGWILTLIFSLLAVTFPNSSRKQA